MANPKFIALLKVLNNATKEGKVNWQETADEDAFRVLLGSGMVRIESGFGEDTGHQYRAFLLNQKGRTIDELWVGEGRDEYGLLDGLYSLARASALNIDMVVDSMLANLKAS